MFRGKTPSVRTLTLLSTIHSTLQSPNTGKSVTIRIRLGGAEAWAEGNFKPDHSGFGILLGVHCFRANQIEFQLFHLLPVFFCLMPT